MADFYDRVKLLMRHYKVNKREFVNNCDISYGTLSGSKSRYNDPQLKTIRKILRAYPAVRVEWLAFGEGEMFYPPAPDPARESAEVARLKRQIEELTNLLLEKERKIIELSLKRVE